MASFLKTASFEKYWRHPDKNSRTDDECGHRPEPDAFFPAHFDLPEQRLKGRALGGISKAMIKVEGVRYGG